MGEAPLESTKFGLRPGGEGWFVMSARESRWRETGQYGAFCNFEGKRRFPGLGINLNVLQPGEPMGLYHRENAEENFVVLAVGARGRRRKGLVYPVSDVAVKRGAGVKRETADSSEAYGSFANWKRSRYKEGWLPDLDP